MYVYYLLQILMLDLSNLTKIRLFVPKKVIFLKKWIFHQKMAFFAISAKGSDLEMTF